MHLVIILRRNSTIVAENKLIGPKSNMEIGCKQGKKNWHWSAVCKDKEYKGKHCCVFFLKVEFLSLQIAN